MSMTEIAYQIKDYANVLVSSEGLGYGPPPYDQYLSSLASNSSISPSTFASEVVTDYMDWCMPIAQIKNATMSATDLTKITSLMAAIDDFVLKLKEKATLYHEQISLVRNLTDGYEGPYAGESGYYIDLYHFAQLIYQHVLNEELRNTAEQVMTALSIGNTIIIEADKAHPNSHGLSILFPDEKGKYYDSYGSEYEKTTFAVDTPWDEFVKYHLSGYVLTILTAHSGIQVKVGEDLYTTDADGKIQVFVLPGYYSVSVATTVLIGPGSRGVFTQWNDGSKANSRTLFVSITDMTLEAEYEIQYYLAVTSLYGSPTPTSGWFESGESIVLSVTSPMSGQAGTRYIFTLWNGTGSVPSSGTNTSVTFIIDKPSSITWNWKTQYLLVVRTDPAGLSPMPNVSVPGPWYDNGASVACTAQEISGYVFNHWTLDGASWGLGVNPITVTMDDSWEALAHYVRPRSWLEDLLSTVDMKVILAFVALVITSASIGTAWVRTRRRRGIMKALLNKIDGVYSKSKMDPQKCEDELCKLRNTILEGLLADGKITEASHSILEKRIDKYIEELRKQKWREDADE